MCRDRVARGAGLERSVEELPGGAVRVGAAVPAELCSLLLAVLTPQLGSTIAAIAGPSANARAAPKCQLLEV